MTQDMTHSKTALTGIKPTGIPHLGNYFGAIKPALQLMNDFHCYYFIADYHAITTLKNPDQLRQYTYEVAAMWLALGLDPDKHFFYRQSDISEIFELAWILSCSASKGLLNRGHAYKAIQETNLEKGQPEDDGINTGIFSYPVLMAADILLFDCQVVPVGLDQKQHVEIARDIAKAFNHTYGDILIEPEPLILKESATILGVDGRKMSKNYQNTISIFGNPKDIKKQIMSIQTDSTPLDDPKDPDSCQVFQLYSLFATESQQEDMAQKYRAGGFGYGHAKKELLDVLTTSFSEASERYHHWIQNTSEIDSLLKKGALNVRQQAAKKCQSIRSEIGL